MHRLALAACAAGAIAAPATAQFSTTFDFEGLPTGTQPDTVSYSQDGVTIQFVTEPQGELSINSSNFFPPSFGSRALFVGADMIPDIPAATAINFVGGVAGVRFEWGDFGGDNDNITFTTYTGANGTGSVIQSDSFTYFGAFPDQVPVYEFLFTAPTNALGSLVITGTGFGGGPSIYLDNITVFVPGPGGFVAVLAMGAVAGRRRR